MKSCSTWKDFILLKKICVKLNTNIKTINKILDLIFAAELSLDNI